MERQTGSEGLVELASELEAERITFADTRTQPRSVMTSCEWSGSETGGRRYSPFVINTEHKKPWHTLTGRQHFFVQHDWIAELGEQLPVYRPPLNTLQGGAAAAPRVPDDADGLVRTSALPRPRRRRRGGRQPGRPRPFLVAWCGVIALLVLTRFLCRSLAAGPPGQAPPAPGWRGVDPLDARWALCMEGAAVASTTRVVTVSASSCGMAERPPHLTSTCIGAVASSVPTKSLTRLAEVRVLRPPADGRECCHRSDRRGSPRRCPRSSRRSGPPRRG